MYLVGGAFRSHGPASKGVPGRHNLPKSQLHLRRGARTTYAVAFAEQQCEQAKFEHPSMALPSVLIQRSEGRASRNSSEDTHNPPHNAGGHNSAN